MSRLPNIGLSMTMVEHKAEIYYFKFVHSKEYQNQQKMFWAATHSMQHEGLMRLLEANGFHLDTVIQASNLLRMSDDSQNASLLIERALCVAESALVSLFGPIFCSILSLENPML